MKGAGQEGQGALFTSDTSEVAITLPPAAIEEVDDSLGKLLTVIGDKDDGLLGATNTFAAAQGPGEEAAEDVDNRHII